MHRVVVQSRTAAPKRALRKLDRTLFTIRYPQEGETAGVPSSFVSETGRRHGRLLGPDYRTPRFSPRTVSARPGRDVSALELLRWLGFAQALQAVAEPALQRRRRIRVECHQVPQRLATIPAQPRQRSSIRVWM